MQGASSLDHFWLEIVHCSCHRTFRYAIILCYKHTFSEKGWTFEPCQSLRHRKVPNFVDYLSSIAIIQWMLAPICDAFRHFFKFIKFEWFWIILIFQYFWMVQFFSGVPVFLKFVQLNSQKVLMVPKFEVNGSFEHFTFESCTSMKFQNS